MTKLYAYTDELSGRDGEDKISFGHFYEENGICSACADAPRHSDGLGGQKCGRLIENNECMWVTGYSGSDYRVHGYDSELCDSPECGANTFGNDPVNVEYEYGWAFFGRSSSTKDNFASDWVPFKIDPSRNSTTRNTCRIDINNEQTSTLSHSINGAPFFVNPANQYCSINTDDIIGRESGTFYGNDGGNMAPVSTNDHCLLRCEYNLENDFKLKEKVLHDDDDKGKCLKSINGSWGHRSTDPSTMNPTNSEAVFDVQNRQINCGQVPGQDTGDKWHYVPRHSAMIDNISDDHNEKIPANIKAYGEKFFRGGGDEEPNYYKSWTFGKLMKDLCQNVEYDSEFCPVVSPPQNYCSYFDSTRPSLMIAGAGSDQNICKHWLNYVKDGQNIEQADTSTTPGDLSETISEIGIYPDWHTLELSESSKQVGDLMYDYDLNPSGTSPARQWWVQDFSGRDGGRVRTTGHSYKLWHNAEDALKNYCDEIYKEAGLENETCGPGDGGLQDNEQNPNINCKLNGENLNPLDPPATKTDPSSGQNVNIPGLSLPLDPICGCYKRQYTAEYYNFRKPEARTALQPDIQAAPDVCIFRGTERCNKSKPIVDSVNLFQDRFSFTPINLLQENDCDIPQCINTLNIVQTDIGNNASVNISGLEQSCTITDDSTNSPTPTPEPTPEPSPEPTPEPEPSSGSGSSGSGSSGSDSSGIQQLCSAGGDCTLPFIKKENSLTIRCAGNKCDMEGVDKETCCDNIIMKYWWIGVIALAIIIIIVLFAIFGGDSDGREGSP